MVSEEAGIAYKNVRHQTYLLPKEDFLERVFVMFGCSHLTNQELEECEFEVCAREFLGVEHFRYMTNGTIAIPIAMRALGGGGEVIIAPFSSVATTFSILCERFTPVFVDIELGNFVLDPAQIEAVAIPRAKDIIPMHMFSYLKERFSSPVSEDICSSIACLLFFVGQEEDKGKRYARCCDE